jgi:hypothetical protein
MFVYILIDNENDSDYKYREETAAANNYFHLNYTLRVDITIIIYERKIPEHRLVFWYNYLSKELSDDFLSIVL